MKNTDRFNIFIIILLFICLFSLFSINVRAFSGMNHIHYMISGGGSGLNDLRLETNYRLDHINRANLLLYYDIENFNIEAAWELNFWRSNTEELSLQLALASNRNKNRLGQALGLKGSGEFTGSNNYFFNMKYYFDEQQLVSQGGITVPIIYDSKLSLGLGNSYWNDNYLFNLGVKFNF